MYKHSYLLLLRIAHIQIFSPKGLKMYVSTYFTCATKNIHIESSHTLVLLFDPIRASNLYEPQDFSNLLSKLGKYNFLWSRWSISQTPVVNVYGGLVMITIYYQNRYLPLTLSFTSSCNYECLLTVPVSTFPITCIKTSDLLLRMHHNSEPTDFLFLIWKVK